MVEVVPLRANRLFYIKKIYIGRRLAFIMANVDGSIRIGIQFEEQNYKRTLSELKKSAMSTTKDLEKLFKDMGNGMSLEDGVAEFQRIQMSMSKITQQAELLRERFKGLDAIKLTLGAEDVSRSLTRARELAGSFYDLLETYAPEINVEDAEFEANLADAQRRYNDFISTLSNTDIDLDVDGMDTIDLFGDTAFDAELADVRRSLSGFLDNIDLGSISRDANGIDTINSKIDELRRKRDTLNRALQRGIISDVEFQADTEEIDEAIRELENERVSIEVELEADDNSLNSLNSAALSFSDLVNADLLADAIRELANALIELGKASLESGADFQTSYVRIKDTFGDASKSIYDFAQVSTDMLGMSETAYLKSAAAIGVFAKGYIKDTDRLASVTMGMSNAIADLSAQTGFNIDETMQKVLSGLRGNTEAIEELGINVKVADMQTWLDTKGIEAKFENLNSELQNLYRTWYMLEKVASNGALGASAKMMETYAGQVKVLKANFDELKTTMGTYLMQALVPILKVINEILARLVDVANLIGDAFGLKDKYTLATDVSMNTSDTDFSAYFNSLADIEAQATDVANAQGGITDELDKTAKAAKKALAPFHQLNILQNKDSSSESNKTISYTPEINSSGLNSALDKLMNDSSGWLSPFDEFMDRVSKIEVAEHFDKFKNVIKGFVDGIKDFAPLIEGITKAILVFISAKVLGSFITKLLGLKGVASIVGALSTAFGIFRINLAMGVGVFKAAGAGLKTLGTMFVTFMRNLSPLAKTVVTIAGLIAVFATFKSAIKTLTLKSYSDETNEFSLSWDNVSTALMNMLPIFVLVEIALYSMLGPIGVVMGAVAALVGAFLGYTEAIDEIKNKASLEDFFDGEGVSLDYFKEKFKGAYEEMLTSFDIIGEYSDKMNENGETIKKTGEKIDTLSIAFQNASSVTEEEVEKMKGLYEELAEAVVENIDLASDTVLTWMNSQTEYFEQLGLNVGELSGTILDAGQQAKQEAKKIQEEMDAIVEKGTSASSEDWKRFGELNAQLVAMGDTAVETGDKIDTFMTKVNSGKIDFGSPEVLKESLEELQNMYDQLLADTDDRYIMTKKSLMELEPYMEPETYKTILSSFESSYNQLTADIAANARFDFSVINDAFEKQANEVINDAIKNQSNGDKFVSDVKTFLFGAFSDDIDWSDGQLERVKNAVGRDTYKMLTETEKELESIMDKYGGYDSTAYKKFFEAGERNAMGYSDGISNAISGSGEDLVPLITNTLQSNIISGVDNLNVRPEFNRVGANIYDGLAEGLENNADKPKNELESMASELPGIMRTPLGIHSPSTVFAEIGGYIIAGLFEGISNTKNTVIEELKSLALELATLDMGVAKFKLQGTSIVDSIREGILSGKDALLQTLRDLFNSMSDIGDKFFSNIGGAINKAAVSLDGVSTPSDLTTASATLSTVTIPKLAKGTVIKPNQRFLAELGDQTRGINIETPLETMLDAFNNALADNGYGSGGDITIPVYIGNELLDEYIVDVNNRDTYRNNGR